MGNSESVPIPGGGTEGYHVLRVQDNSPGQAAGLEPFFDFIICIGQTRLDKDNDTLKEILKQHVEHPLELTVYNSKNQTVRQTQITPSQMWGGQGLLGVSIRFCSFDGASQNVWHVISVQPNSPARLPVSSVTRTTSSAPNPSSIKRTTSSRSSRPTKASQSSSTCTTLIWITSVRFP
ncbi:hypothetical protein L596_027280 [Steinernema carpocapsae]|uniref:PDZ GRASP-type domain-containing protein n=1 Tax=Steinernema carpocapsae TaxID=34508 RepID=A0A4U5M3U7_STECR|nr:hypothetical protein L596_027280 [Steinernema carpocapsae]